MLTLAAWVCMCIWDSVLQEKQAAQQAPVGSAADAEDEARLQEQLQELTAKIAELDEGEGSRTRVQPVWG